MRQVLSPLDREEGEQETRANLRPSRHVCVPHWSAVPEGRGGAASRGLDVIRHPLD